MLIAHHPTLALLAAPGSRPQRRFLNVLALRPQCFFLQSDGYCQVHVEHGRATKPFVCRTFPANKYALRRGLLVAGFNFFCPLESWRGAPGQHRVRHADLERDIREAWPVLLAQVEDRLDLPDGQAGRVLTPAAADYEEWCRDLPVREQVDDALDLFAIFALTARRWRSAANPAPSDRAAARAALEHSLAGMATFLGVSPPAANAVNDAMLIALSPHLRLIAWRELSHLDHRAGLAIFPRWFCALRLYLDVFSRTGRAAVTPATVIDLAEQLTPSLFLLAHLDSVPSLPGVGRIELDPGTSEKQAAEALLRLIQRNRRDQSLRQLIEGMPLDQSRDRSLLLQSLPAAVLTHLRFSRPRATSAGENTSVSM
jgi:hypothetical protein